MMERPVTSFAEWMPKEDRVVFVYDDLNRKHGSKGFRWFRGSEAEAVGRRLLQMAKKKQDLLADASHNGTDG